MTCVLPGCVSLWGLGRLYTPLQEWIDVAALGTATIGSFFYALLASIGAGLTVGCLRWIVIDSIHHRTGVRPPNWDFAKLSDRTEAVNLIIDIHYKYYLFYANTLIAVLFAYSAWRGTTSLLAHVFGWPEVITAAVCVMFFAASRDTLGRYYHRVGELLCQEHPKRKKGHTKKSAHRPLLRIK